MSATNTPKGLQKKLGVTIEGGCGDAECRDCYEPEGLPVSWPADLSTRIALEIREQVEAGNVGLAASDAARVAAGYYKPLVDFVATIARMNWDGEEREDGTEADISNDDNHDTVVSLIQGARGLRAKAEGRGE